MVDDIQLGRVFTMFEKDEVWHRWLKHNNTPEYQHCTILYYRYRILQTIIIWRFSRLSLLIILLSDVDSLTIPHSTIIMHLA